MIDFIKDNIKDISYWLMFLAMVGAYILLYFQRKAYRKLDEKHLKLLINLLEKESELLSIIHAVENFIEKHNYWHERKISFYYDQNGWHCCYADEMPQGDTFITEEEITPLNEKDNENQQSI